MAEPMSDTPIYDAVLDATGFNPEWPTAKVLAARPWQKRKMQAALNARAQARRK